MCPFCITAAHRSLPSAEGENARPHNRNASSYLRVESRPAQPAIAKYAALLSVDNKYPMLYHRTIPGRRSELCGED